MNAARIGVLAIQGDYEAHAAALAESGAEPSLIKTPGGLATIDGLILPGGESTTMLKFLERDGSEFFEALRSFAQAKPVFGTCAGAILLASEVRSPNNPGQSQRCLGILDVAVERNAYGRQNDSAILMLETSLPSPAGQPSPASDPMETVFIRAPRIVSTGASVETLASRDGFPVLIRQGKTLAATFHPELSPDRRVHRLFVETVLSDREKTGGV